MVNQQLLDYVREQVQVGVSKDEIKNALLGSGWSEADVNETLASVNRPSVVTSPAVPRFAPGNAVMTSDIFQPQNGEPVFDPKTKSAAPTAKPAAAAPSAAPARAKQAVPPQSAPATAAKGGWSSYLMKFAVPGLLGVGLVGAGWFAYSLSGEKTDLESRLMTAQAEKQNLNDQLSLSAKDKNDLATQVTTLTETNESLSADLEIFKVPDGASPAATGTVSAQGTLHGPDANSIYTVTLKSGVVVVIKNSKDANVGAALKPLVGTPVTLSGEHVVGSREITVTAVNGSGVAAAEAKAAPEPPAETSTP